MHRVAATLLLCVLATGVSFAQTISIEGQVVETSGLPVTGASVIEANTSNGVITDLDGNFTISVGENASLVVSCIGYITQTINVGTRAKLLITLEEDQELLDEIVVVGYTTQRKVDLTGAISVVSTDDFKTSPSTDPMGALQGKVAGMTITQQGNPQGTATIRIRGIGSFNSSQDPLFVIDGVPTTSTLNSLNSNDIESIQVLKDAASASIYGSRAANGVIVITTKQGKKSDKIHVDFSANVTAQFYTSQSKMDLCNTEEYATAMAQAALNDGLDPVAYASNYGMDFNASNGVRITAYDPAADAYVNYTVNGLYDGYINSSKTMKFSNTDWLDAISRVGVSQSYNLSISNATDKLSSMFSVGYKKNSGILYYTSFENISARLNNTYKFNKYLSVGENFTLTYTKQCDSYPMENALKMAPIVPVYEEDGVTFGGPVGGMSDRQNPLRELYDNRDNYQGIWRVFGNVFLNITPIEGLVLRSNLGLDYDTSFIHSLTYTYSSDIVNNDTPSTTLSQANDTKWNWSNTANYNFKIAEDHSFGILAGMEIYKQNRVDFSAYAEDFAIESVDYMWPDASTGTQRATGASSGYSLVSFFGKIEYNWKDILLGSVTYRRDGSSRFGTNNKWGNFPAATAGWRISKLMNSNWIDDIKLRFSWGMTGNQDISNTARYGLYYADYGDDRVTSTAYDLYLQGSGIFPSGYRTTQTANNDLKWETTIQYDWGVDFAFFNNRLSGSIDGYIKNIKDMLISPAYLGALGEGGSTWSNGPSLRDVGMEFVINHRNSFANGFGYDIDFNLDFYRNWVTYLPSSTTGSYAHTTTENLVEAKKPYGSIVGYVVEGLFQNEDEVLSSGQENARVGGLKYADLDGNGIINSDDQTWIYNPVPDFSYGLNIVLTYKNFDLTMFWQGVAGVDVYNNQKFQTDFWSVTDAGSNKGTRVLDAWTQANTSSTIPALTTDNTADEGRASSYFVENGSYLKLRTLQLGYNLPESFLNKCRMSSARIYLSGQNLLTIKSKSLTCSDPENPNWNYPLATSVSFGIQIGF